MLYIILLISYYIVLYYIIWYHIILYIILYYILYYIILYLIISYNIIYILCINTIQNLKPQSIMCVGAPMSQALVTQLASLWRRPLALPEVKLPTWTKSQFDTYNIYIYIDVYIYIYLLGMEYMGFHELRTCQLFSKCQSKCTVNFDDFTIFHPWNSQFNWWNHLMFALIRLRHGQLGTSWPFLCPAVA